jgi:hypothetical protein
MITPSSTQLTHLVRFFARSAPAVRLAPCGQPAEVVLSSSRVAAVRFSGNGGVVSRIRFGLGKQVL